MKRALQKTPLEVGNLIAWIILSSAIGFALGWIVNAERLYAYCLVV